MNKLLRIVLLSWVAMALSVPSGKAQDTTEAVLPAQWTLEDCINYARQHNIQLNTLRLDQQSAREDFLQSRAATLPGLSGSVSQSVVNSKNADPVVGGFQTQANFSSSYGLSSSIVLYNGGYLRNDIRQKDLSVKAANLSVQQAENDITLSITQAYLNILLTKENIIYIQDLVTTSQAQLKQGQQRFDAGSIARKDLVQLEAQVANDQYTLVTAQNTLRQNILTLKQVLQLPTSFDFKVSTPDTLIAKAMIPSLQEAQATALQSRPEVKAGELSVQLAEVGLAKARAGYKPTLSLGASLSTGYSDNQSSKYLSQINDNFYQRLGLSLSVPIFSNRTNKTNVARSKIQIEQARLSLQDTRTVLSQQVEQSYIDVVNAQSQLQAAEVQLKANQESYRITNEQLQLGAVSMVDLLQQKNLYMQALQAYIQAKYNTILSQKIYDFYTGVPVTL